MLGIKAKFPVGYDKPDEGPGPADRHRAASARSPVPTRRTSPASASTRCGPRTTSTTSVRASGSTPAAPARWATRVPAAMGAQVGLPGSVVWAIDGDGCFQMTNQELATCALEGIPIKVAVINNSSLGMVRQWQTLLYEGRYSNTDLNTGPESIGARRIPDFVKLADAYGCVGLRCDSEADLDATIEKAHGDHRPPVVIDFVVERDAMVWPMVHGGTSNDDIQIARDLAPKWDEEDL